MDPAATAILKRMTDYLGSLKAFSVHTQNTIEDLLAPGERIDLEVSATVTVERPNKLLTERKGDLVSQNFYYDGKTLTLYDPSKKVYATEPAAGTLEGMLDYARDTLGLVIPASDLVYPNAYELLMKDVTAAKVIGKTVVGGVKCDHLLFRRPGVDFQVWIADGKEPLPRQARRHRHGDPGAAERRDASFATSRRCPTCPMPGSSSCRPRGPSRSRSCTSSRSDSSSR